MDVVTACVNAVVAAIKSNIIFPINMCLNNKRPPKAAVTIKPYNIMAQNHSQSKKVYDAMRLV